MEKINLAFYILLTPVWEAVSVPSTSCGMTYSFYAAVNEHGQLFHVDKQISFVTLTHRVKVNDSSNKNLPILYTPVFQNKTFPSYIKIICDVFT